MKIASGIKVVSGIAIGKIKYYRKKTHELHPESAADSDFELKRFESARECVKEQQHMLYEKALEEMGRESAEIFMAHELLMEDAALIGECRKNMAEQRMTAENAVKQGFDRIISMLRVMEDDFFRERCADIEDLQELMLDELTRGAQASFLEPAGNGIEGEKYILAARDLTPSDMVKLDKKRILGIVIKEGNPYNHVAILAKSMNLPALVQCRELGDDWEGKPAVLDGGNSCIYIEPDEDMMRLMSEKRDAVLKNAAILQALKGKDNITLDGKKVQVFANIGELADIDKVQANDAGGIGLFRTEFLYINSSKEPSEERQFEVYRQVLESLSPMPVIVRTCDIGADKIPDYMQLERESNPALGLRGIRLCLVRRDMFKRQLRALLRASNYGNLGIMFPMITSVRELKSCKELLEECRRELRDGNISYGNLKTGVMIETPAAALCAEELAEEAEFFSLGTNDLAQYTCAMDRENASLAPFLDTHSPAVLKLVKMTVDAGHRHGIPVGICGELGADEALTERFLALGVDEFSVNPGNVLSLRKKIRSICLDGGKDGI